MTTIQDLPPELLSFHILPLTGPSLIDVTRVCHSWRNATLSLRSVEPIMTKKELKHAIINNDIWSVVYMKCPMVDVNQCLCWTCESGHLALAELMIKLDARLVYRGLSYACEHGHLALAELMIKHGANNWNVSLTYACEYGHLALAELMIKHGATDLNLGLRYALEAGHVALIELMIKHGASK